MLLLNSILLNCRAFVTLDDIWQSKSDILQKFQFSGGYAYDF